MILHALVDDLRVARVAIEGGATLVQLRLKERSTIQRIEQGVPFRDLCARSGVTFVVNDAPGITHALLTAGIALLIWRIVKRSAA